MFVVLLLGVSLLMVIVLFVVVLVLFVLLIYLILLVVVEMDDIGLICIGKYVFNYVFLIFGVIVIMLCVIFGFIFGGIML